LTWKIPIELLGDKFGVMTNIRHRLGLGPHRGTDFKFAENEVIGAFTDGVFVKTYWSNALGWVVVQTIKDDPKRRYLSYCHLAMKPTSIRPGGTAAPDRPIGRCGGGPNTPSGSASTGAHCHVVVSDTIDGAMYGKVYDLLKVAKKGNK
jgi:hypothetical protein